MKKAVATKKRVPKCVADLEYQLSRQTQSTHEHADRARKLQEEVTQLQSLLAYRDRQLDAAGTALANQSADRVGGGIAQQNAAWTRQREEMARTIRNLERECAEYKAKLMLAEDKLKVQVSPRESLRAFLRGILDEE